MPPTNLIFLWSSFLGKFLKHVYQSGKNHVLLLVASITCGPYFGIKFKGRSSSSAAPIQTIQPVRDRQNTRLSFSCQTNRRPVAFTWLFTRTNESSRIIRCLIRFMLQQAKTWEEMRQVQVPISKHSQTAILWTYQSSSKKNNTPSNSTSHGQEVRNLAKVSYWQCTCPSPSAHLLGTFGHGNISIPPLGAQNYSTIRLLTLCVKFDEISPRTPELEHLPWTAFIRCVWNVLFPVKAPFAKNAPFPIFAFFVCFLLPNQSNVSRNMLKIQTESYFHFLMSKWPIPTTKL